MIEGMLITAGITLSYWVNYGESHQLLIACTANTNGCY